MILDSGKVLYLRNLQDFGNKHRWLPPDTNLSCWRIRFQERDSSFRPALRDCIRNNLSSRA